MQNRSFNLRDDETLFEAMRLFTALDDEFTPIVKEMDRLFDFTIAELQWERTIRANLRSEGRPANSYNFLVGIINAIYGVQYDNRKQGKVTPRTGGDRQFTQIVNQVLRYYFYWSGYKKAQKKAATDKLIAGLSVYQINWKYEGSTDLKGKLACEANDPRQFRYEPIYNDPQWSKSGFVMRKHPMSLEEILNKFSLNDDEMFTAIMEEARIFFLQGEKRDKWISKKLKALISAVYETTTGNYTEYNSNLNNWWDPATGKFDVLELHEKRTERRLMVWDSGRQKNLDITDPYWGDFRQLQPGKQPNGFTFDPEIINGIKKRYNINGDAKTDLMPRRFMTAVIPTFRLKVNEQVYPFQTDYYVYIPEQCYDYHANPLKIHSVLSDLVDPQADYNKSKSLILELIGRYANKGWVMDENAIDGLQEDWENNRIAPYRRVKAGYINMIRPEPEQNVQQELVRAPADMFQTMQAISNTLNMEISGAQNPDVKSGVHFLAKEKSQTKSFTYILENRDDTLYALTYQAMKFISHFVTTQTVVRITQDINPSVQGPREVTVNQSRFSIDNGQIIEQVINDLDAYEYDVEISEDPFSPTAQEEKQSELANLFNAAVSVNPQKADVLLDIIVEENYPEISEKVLTAWEKLGQPNPQQQQQNQVMQALQLILVKLGIQQKGAEVANTEAEAKGKQINNLKNAHELSQMAKNNALGVGQAQPKNGKPKQPAAA